MRFIIKASLLAGLVTLAAPSLAQNAAEQRAPWLVSCSNQNDADVLACEMSQSIVIAQGNQRVATVALLKSKGLDDINGLFTLPVGLHLPAGLAFDVDGQQVSKMAFQTCDTQGCYALGGVDAAWVDAMRKGDVLTLTTQRQDQQEISFSFDLKGVSKTMDLMP